MVEILCAACDRPVPDGLLLCQSCGQTLTEDLASIPGLVCDLAIMRAGLGRLTSDRTVGRSGTPPLPVQSIARERAEDEPDDAVGMELRGDRAFVRLENTITTWARTMAETLGVEIPIGARGLTRLVLNGRGQNPHDRSWLPLITASTLEQAAIWMACHPHELRAHEAAGDMAREISRDLAALRRVIDLPPEMRPLGPCPAQLEDGSECGTALYAEKGATYVKCPARNCRTQHDVYERERAAAMAAEDQLYTVPELLSILTAIRTPVPRPTLYRWAAKRTIAPRGFQHVDERGQATITDYRRDKRDRPVYRLGDVRALALKNDNAGGSAA